MSNNRKINKKQKSKKQNQMAPLYKEFPSQVVAQLKMVGTAFSLSTTVTTGVISFVVQVGPLAIQDFVTRFSGTFQEYRIVRAKFKVNKYSSTNSGLFSIWADTIVLTVPTAAEALNRSRRQFSCAGPGSETLTWTNHDTNDLQWHLTTETAAIAVFKIYTEAANFGSNIVATPYCNITSEFYVQFRDLV